MKDETCKDRVKEAFRSRMTDIRKMYKREQAGERVSTTDELPPLSEYGLCIDYVEPNTFNDQPHGYWRYQISWGGPSEEFRLENDRVRFWFLDWFDGASIAVSGKDADIIKNIIQNAQ